VTVAPLILTYHGVDAGPPPLFVAPDLFAVHLTVLERAGADVVTVATLASRLTAGTLRPGTVALSFDDGLASVAEHAAPLLRRHGWPATAYCVAGYLGGANDWPTQPAGVPRRPLLTGAAVARLAAEGFEIGAHTMSHRPLGHLSGTALEEEIVGCGERLAAAAGVPITTFAAPYGDPPSGAARTLIAAAYAACCGTHMDIVAPPADVYALPRIDAHYLRRPGLLQRLLHGELSYLRLRRAGARVRRLGARDFRRG
jgi:peptidoglycan/xylan/chitin deacetylase (PgdA/CDA1 family)